MKVKLIDVANKAGVSKSTASQYINGRYEYMSAETKERLRLAIEELNFIPNPIARSLKTSKTNTIGIMVSDIAGPMTSKVIRGVDDYCKKHNYNLMIYNTDYDEGIERKSISTLKQLQADGLIISSSGLINDLLNTEDTSGLPIVHIHRNFNNLKVNTVFSDFFTGAYEGTSHLLDLNHHRIGLITRSYLGIPTRENRINGYLKALSEKGIKKDLQLIKLAENAKDVQAAYDQLMNLPQPPTAIFTMYTLLTAALLEHLGKLNINIPKHLSLVAFDDLPYANLLKTPPTVISQSAYSLGQEACQLLLSKIEEPSRQQDNIVLPCHLIVRNSCEAI